jgi:hypothetical protein
MRQSCETIRPPASCTFDVMWERWRKGETLHQIARLFDRVHSSVQGILEESGGGIQPGTTAPLQSGVDACRTRRDLSFRGGRTLDPLDSIPPRTSAAYDQPRAQAQRRMPRLSCKSGGRACLGTSAPPIARRLNERPRKTLNLDNRLNNFIKLLHRPIESAAMRRHSSAVSLGRSAVGSAPITDHLISEEESCFIDHVAVVHAR